MLRYRRNTLLPLCCSLDFVLSGHLPPHARAPRRPPRRRATRQDAPGSIVAFGEPSAGASSAPAPINVFRHTRDGRSVDIDVGTNHSAKGQTHRGTLVLETYFNTHDLASLLRWLSGTRRGWSPEDRKECGERLRVVFAAMTRPTHLLCLAIRREALGNDLGADARTAELQARGWHLSVLGPAQ